MKYILPAPLKLDFEFNTNIQPQPFLKWAGGKRQLLPEIRKYIPNNINQYFEPFVGAGAVLFDLKPQRATIGDVNSELINCYNVIRNNCDELICDLGKHINTKEYFYSIRELDRTEKFQELTAVERASRIIFLNKTCFNGLFRVNRNDQFNAPYGRYKNPKYADPNLLKSISNYLNSNEITILNQDFSIVTEGAERGDFIYFDPPYDPLSDTSSFTGYSLNQFQRTEQIRLKNLFEDLTRRGCQVMLSNSSTNFIAELYQDYNIIRVPANRNINSKGDNRKKVDEFLILNYAI